MNTRAFYLLFSFVLMWVHAPNIAKALQVSLPEDSFLAPKSNSTEVVKSQFGGLKKYLQQVPPLGEITDEYMQALGDDFLSFFETQMGIIEGIIFSTEFEALTPQTIKDVFKDGPSDYSGYPTYQEMHASMDYRNLLKPNKFREALMDRVHSYKSKYMPIHLDLSDMMKTISNAGSHELLEALHAPFKALMSEMNTMTNHINRVLYQLKNPKLSESFQPITYNDFVGQIWEAFRTYEKQGWSLRLMAESNFEEVVFPSLLAYSFQDIVNNAVQAYDQAPATRGGKILLLSILKENDRMVVSLLDQSGGLPKEKSLDSLFDGTTTKESGSGIGLSQAKQRALRLGGNAWAKKRFRGLKFFLSFRTDWQSLLLSPDPLQTGSGQPAQVAA